MTGSTTLKTTEKTTEKTVGKTVGKTAGKIKEMMRHNPEITIPQMASEVQTSESNVLKHIANLQKQGSIRRVGGRKGGYWEVLK